MAGGPAAGADRLQQAPSKAPLQQALIDHVLATFGTATQLLSTVVLHHQQLAKELLNRHGLHILMTERQILRKRLFV